MFYPKGLRQADELSFAASRFRTIEINGTFYGLQKPDSFAAWAAAVPDDFVFSVKAPRFLTHIRRLRDIEGPLANFLGSGVLRLGEKLGPLLWQFPPNFQFDAERFAAFLPLLPRDTQEAAAFVRAHFDPHMRRPPWTEVETARPMRHAIEVRHESFRDPAFIGLLRRHGVALVCADTVAWPRLMDLTSDFAYCRLHGSEELYVSGYDDAALDIWAGRVRDWAAGREPADAERIGGAARRRLRDVFVYFDNDAKVLAPRDAAGLMRRVGQAVPFPICQPR